MKGKIERAHGRLKKCYRHRDGFLKSLGQIDERVAGDVISEVVFRFSRSLRELAESSTEEERLQHATDLVEEQLDLLIEASRWSHPVQVLDKPRAEFSALLRACRLRLFSAQGESQKHLQAVQKKLEQAIRIAEAARRRRAAMRG